MGLLKHVSINFEALMLTDVGLILCSSKSAKFFNAKTRQEENYLCLIIFV